MVLKTPASRHRQGLVFRVPERRQMCAQITVLWLFTVQQKESMLLSIKHAQLEPGVLDSSNRPEQDGVTQAKGHITK